MTSRVARDVAPCDQLQIIGDKLHELKRLLPILHFHSLLETVERTPVDPNGSDTERANTSDNGDDAMSKPKTYLRLPEIPTLVTSHDLRGSKDLVLLGYRDCSYETHRYMVEVENMPEDDPIVLGLQQHLEQHWLRMDIQSLISDVLNEDNPDCNANTGNNVSAGTGVGNGTENYCSSNDGRNSLREQCIGGLRRHLRHRQPLHRHHRHHPHQRNHQHNQTCSQSRMQNSVRQRIMELNPLNVRVDGVGNERSGVEVESQRTDNESSKTHELLELQSVISDIVKPSSSSSESESDRTSEGGVRGLLTSENDNPLLATHTSTNNNGPDNNNNNNDINEMSNNNDVSLKDEDPERWKQLNLSIARVTQELIVLLENEGSSLSDGEEGFEDDGEEGFEDDEEDEENDELIQDITLSNGLEK